MSSRFVRSLAAGIALLLLLGTSFAEEPLYPEAMVTVSSTHVSPSPYPVLVQFDTPFPREAAAAGDTYYLVGKHKELLICQLEPLSEPPSGRTFTWQHVITLVPQRNEPFLLIAMPGPPKVAVPAVSAQLAGNSARLETTAVQAWISTRAFRVADELSLFGQLLVPEYTDNLINRQQNIELVLTDRLRHVDFILQPKVAEGGFTLEKAGPVIATGAYRGQFGGNENVKAVPFEGRLSLMAHGLMSLSITLPAGAFDEERFSVKEFHVTIPLVLRESAVMSFGAMHEEARGRHFWEGTARLTAEPDGAYKFTDCDASGVTGNGGLCWADYASDEAGLGIVWDTKKYSMAISAEYSEDLVDIRVTPPDTTAGGPVSADIFLLFHPGHAELEVLGSVADGLFLPPKAEMCEEYVRAVTAFK